MLQSASSTSDADETIRVDGTRDHKSTTRLPPSRSHLAVRLGRHGVLKLSPMAGVDLLIGRNGGSLPRNFSLQTFQSYKDLELSQRGGSDAQAALCLEYETLALRCDPPTVSVDSRPGEDGRESTFVTVSKFAAEPFAKASRRFAAARPRRCVSENQTRTAAPICLLLLTLWLALVPAGGQRKLSGHPGGGERACFVPLVLYVGVLASRLAACIATSRCRQSHLTVIS